MGKPVTVVLAFAVVLGGGLLGRANPITYQFSGTFDRPMNGTNQFSGSFTFNPDPTVSNIGQVLANQFVVSKGSGSLSPNGVAQPSGYIFAPTTPLQYTQMGPISEYGPDVSLTVAMGRQVLHDTNTPQNPFAATFLANLTTQPLIRGQTPIPPSDYIRISGVTGNYAPGNSESNNSFAIAFTSPTDLIFSHLPADQVVNLRNFDFTTTFHGAGANDQSGGAYNGTITSIELVSTPEPSTLLGFVTLGIAAGLAKRRQREK